ncbi:MAG: glutamate synthase small subunit, partial [Deltaproteobacteria bacterium]
EFCFNISPREIRRETGSHLCIEVEKTQLGEKAADGRQNVEIIPKTEHCISADAVILALGFDVGTLPGLEKAGVDVDKWGQIQIDKVTGVTSNQKLYSGGDCYRGADLVVTAAADGRRAALDIMRKLLS